MFIKIRQVMFNNSILVLKNTLIELLTSNNYI
jgi:hypothetical protein